MIGEKCRFRFLFKWGWLEIQYGRHCGHLVFHTFIFFSGTVGRIGLIFGVYVPSLEAVQICSIRSIPILNMATRWPFWIQNLGQKSKFSKYGQVACQIEEHNENNSDLFISFHSDLKYGCQAAILDLICKSWVNIWINLTSSPKD